MPGLVNPSGVHRANIAGVDIAAGPIVVSPQGGYLRKVLVVGNNGVRDILLTDGESGPVIGVIPSNAADGAIFSLDMPVMNSINIPQTNGASDLVISYE